MKGNWKGIVTKMACGLAGLGVVTCAGNAWAAEVSPALAGSALKKGDITRVEPPCWWTGMANDTLQLMITGPNIGDAEFSTRYPGVEILRQFKLDSPNYKFVYLKIARDAKAGNVKFDVTRDGKRRELSYPLLARTRKAGDYKGFDASDVLYLLMPDRFARVESEGKGKKNADNGLEYDPAIDRNDPNGRHGGNIAGIKSRLGYLDTLGVTALWMTPVLENDMPGGSYHGYATTDYYRVDPRFGTNDEWNNLIDSAHNMGLKVVMDMIFNHTGVNHPWMKDMPSADWYNHPDGKTLTNFRLTTAHDPYVSDYDKDKTVNGWFVPAMPDLNQRNPEVMKYLIQNSIWWIENSKIDGIRMDTYPYADMRGMSQWGADVLREYPNFNIVGECWYSNEAGSAFWQKDSKLNPEQTNLPTVMDFWAILNGRKAFYTDTDPWHGLNDVYDHLAQDFLYADPQHVLTFLDNHDSDRFLEKMPADSKELGPWKQAMAWLLTTRGIPQIYYGSELLMNGSKEGSDGYIRLDMPGGFPGDKTDAFTADGRTALQNEAYDFLRNVLQWRRNEGNGVISRGSLKHFMPQNGIYAYQRRLGNKEVVVLLNGKDTPNEVTMERTLEVLPYGTVRHDVVSGRDVKIEPTMTFAPRQVMILTNR